MEKIMFLLWFNIIALASSGQNIISNSGFDDIDCAGNLPTFIGGDGASYTKQTLFNIEDNFNSQDSISLNCFVKDWIEIWKDFDVYRGDTKFNVVGEGYSQNWCSKKIYPHSDTTFVGGVLWGGIRWRTIW